MKDYTSLNIKTNKRLLSSLSPTEDKQSKKTKYFSKKSKESSTRDLVEMDIAPGNNSVQMDESEKNHTSIVSSREKSQLLTPENSHTKLEGALGPLVHQIKLLRESFDEKYSQLDDKYTRLETVITSQKNEMSNELGKLHELIANQTQEITTTVERKMEATNNKLEQVVKENILLKRSNTVLQECLSRLEPTHLDNNVILMGIQEQQWEKFEIMRQRVIDVIAEALKPIECSNAMNRAEQVAIAKCN